jgi:hypothetical protein
MMKKLCLNQLVALLLATGWLASFMIVARQSTSGAVTLCLLVGLPALLGCLLGVRMGFQGIGFAVYAPAGMLLLGQLGIYPYYSSDLGALLPAALLSCYLAPASVLATVACVGIRLFVRRKK